MIKSLNSDGFSALEVALGVVVMGIIGGSGYYVYDSQKETAKLLENSEVSTDVQSSSKKKEQPIQSKISKDWLIRKSAEATIMVPDGFNILVPSDSAFDFVLPDEPQGTLSYKKGTIAKIAGEPAKHFELGLIVGYNSEGFNDRGTKLKEFKTYSDLDVVVKIYEQKSEPDGVDFPRGAKHLKYIVIKGDNYISIDYVYLGDGIVTIIDEMVKTADIK